MSDFKKLALAARTLVIFKSLKERTVFSKLLMALEYESAECYCDFVAALYMHSDNLTEYILKLVLENENIFMLTRGAGKKTGFFLDECLANELALIEQIAKVPASEFERKIGFDGFLPHYATTEDIDFSQVYAQRIYAISQYGYGIYSEYHVFMIKNGAIAPVKNPDPISLSQLTGYEYQRKQVIDNTLALLKGRPANNVLLYGDCGTGKSSTVKAIANEYRSQGLRLIELKKKQLHELPNITETVCKNPLKFIIFIDDLSFTEDDDDFAALKAILEGSVAAAADNLVIYATSNRRHLVRETFSSREGDEVHLNDTLQEFLSLSDRFGLSICFQKPDKITYLKVVDELAKEYQLKTPLDEVHTQAEAFAIQRGGRSPRTAKQFIEYLKGNEE
ncbi:MAG: ATP-binding protein [Ruminococcus sp.]|nr:ATP-binding protein [Ruminococcus sp.]